MTRTALGIGFLSVAACSDAARAPSAPAVRDAAPAVDALALDALVPGSLVSSHVFQDLGTLPGGMSSSASGINTAGDVAGSSETQPFAANHAVVWNADGSVTDLGVPPGRTEARAFDINDARTVVGSSTKGISLTGFLWKAGQFTEIRSPAAMQFVQVAAVNNHDVVVGRFRTTAGRYHAFRFTVAGGFVDLHPPSGYRETEASDVNDEGVVVGMATLATGEAHAVYWSAANVMTDLGTVVGGPRAAAQGINNAGEIVGTALTRSTVTVPFLWTRAGGLRIGAGGSATAISDRGRFLGRTNGHRMLPVTKTKTTPAVFLPVPSGTTQAFANFVNRCGSVAGSIVIFGASTVTHAVRWRNQPCD